MCFFGKSKRFGAKRGGLPPFVAFLSRLLLLGLVAAAPLRADPPGYAPWAELLGRYVTPDGVRYEAWHADAEDRAKLDGVLDFFASVGRSALDDDTAAAFLINVYNAAMIQAVLREYPLSSVREIGSSPFAVFKKEFIGLDGETVSLDEVEKGILLEEYSDPRLHFAVNCASVSCPPLRAEPFRGADLDRQLGEQARLFANGAPRRAGFGGRGHHGLFEALRMVRRRFSGRGSGRLSQPFPRRAPAGGQWHRMD